MIERLRGTLVSRRPDRVLVEVGGVGYSVSVPTSTARDLPGVGEEVVLHTHLHVREDAMVLYGFGDESTLDMFRLLLGAPGVGPKVALAMISSLSTDEINRIILSEDADAMTVVPGIGKRSAQKIILELKPKLAGLDVTVVGSAGVTQHVRDALEGLGYTTAEIRDVVGSLPHDETTEQQIRQALRMLGGGG
ncbi:MAG: Holliday junction branch migration protein RuvA [Acidimicrobiia bacterium]|nr:Holliday junction branch migration protein RuvA [Acidimicrobiia bacterium]MDH5422598.1 Holliday junction branch migration protein RuvA [Acidimicrobiia bacterium]MDH5505493.1 Holliday junction branch migration protein RuvA [Acidimicrobiia bacterium]